MSLLLIMVVNPGILVCPVCTTSMYYVYIRTCPINMINSNKSQYKSLLSRIINNPHIYYNDENDKPKSKKKRQRKHQYKRINLQEHFNMCHKTNTFTRRYHMTPSSFYILVSILKKDININPTKSMCSTSGNDPITPRMVVAMGLRYMGGKKITSLTDIFGVSFPSDERMVSLFLNAVDSSTHESLSIDLLPKKDMEANRIAMGWQQRSSAEYIFFGMLGAIDGWLCTTEKPYDIPGPSDYFSGHYQRFGFNVQAMCDTNLRITYFSVTGPGGKNDARVFRRLSKLRRWLSGLSVQYFIAGDNAYPLMNTLLIPFSGFAANDEVNDAYNFNLSQLRIRIEMTFGRLTSKWRIFRTDLPANNGSVKNVMIMRVGAKLHNYVINADQLNFLHVDDNDLATFEVEPLQDGPVGNKGYFRMYSEEDNLDGSEFSRCQDIVNEIESRGLRWPEVA